MSVTLSIDGIRPADGKYLQMFSVLEVCQAANVKVPQEVVDFFNGRIDPEDIDPDGVVTSLASTNNPSQRNGQIPGVSYWEDYGCEGFKIDLRKLDTSIKILRISNSW